MAYTPEERRRKLLRNQFYSTIREVTIPGIQWCPEKERYGNHMDFKVNEVHGHVNWYFRNMEFDNFHGNVCVVFKQCFNALQIPEEFRVHPIHGDWIIASSEIDNISDAVEWAAERIQSIRR